MEHEFAVYCTLYVRDTTKLLIALAIFALKIGAPHRTGFVENRWENHISHPAAKDKRDTSKLVKNGIPYV
jgi:hypothetical protein